MQNNVSSAKRAYCLLWVVIMVITMNGMETKNTKHLAPQRQEFLVRLSYKGEEIQLPLSQVWASKTLRNCIDDMVFNDTQNNDLTISFDDVSDFPFENINELKEIFDTLKDRKTNSNVTLRWLQVIDWLDFEFIELESVEENERGKWFFDAYKEAIRKQIIAYLDTAEYENDAHLAYFLINWFAKVGIKPLNENGLKCGNSKYGPELVVENKHSDTFWGVHRFLTDKTRDTLRGLCLIADKPERLLNLKYYIGLCSYLNALELRSSQSTFGSCYTLHSRFFALSQPLLSSLNNQIQNLKQLHMSKVTFPESLSLEDLITSGKQLEEIVIGDCSVKEKQEVFTHMDRTVVNDKLEKLSLKAVQLAIIPQLIKNLNGLKKLDLSRNNIRHISGSRFPQQLLTCNLSGNPLTSITDDMALPLCALEDPGHHSNINDINVKVSLLNIFTRTETEKLF